MASYQLHSWLSAQHTNFGFASLAICDWLEMWRISHNNMANGESRLKAGYKLKPTVTEEIRCKQCLSQVLNEFERAILWLQDPATWQSSSLPLRCLQMMVQSGAYR
jgi:hypothetical protein